MSVEDLLNKVGGFGTYHWIMMVFVFLTTFMNGINYYAQVFMFTAPPHECNVTNLWKNLSEEGPILVTTDQRMDRNITYNQSMIFPTVTSENNWVCDQDDKPNNIEMAFWSGNIIGFLIWGYTNDKFGRRPTLIAAHFAYILGNVLTFFVPGYYAMLACRFLVGSAHMTVSHLPYMIVLEYCDETTRIRPLLTVMLSYSLSSIFTPLLSMYLTNWQSLLAIATVPNMVVICAYFCGIVPESPAWLLCKGRVDQAVKMLSTVAKVNGVDIKNMEFQKLVAQATATAQPQDESKEGLAQLFGRLRSNKRFAFRSFLAIAVCFIGYTCYYGHVGNTANIGGGNMFLNFVYGAAVEMVVIFALPALLNWYGRRWTFISMLLAEMAASMSYAFLPEGFEYLPRILAILGRVFSAGAYYVCVQFASELFPTEVRGKGSSAFEICGGIGLFIQPKINYLGKSHGSETPLLVYSGLCAVAMAFGFLLPETANEELPQTIEQANIFGKDQSLLHCVPCTIKKDKRVKSTHV